MIVYIFYWIGIITYGVIVWDRIIIVPILNNVFGMDICDWNLLDYNIGFETWIMHCGWINGIEETGRCALNEKFAD